jgi:hypothetical protein
VPTALNARQALASGVKCSSDNGDMNASGWCDQTIANREEAAYATPKKAVEAPAADSKAPSSNSKAAPAATKDPRRPATPEDPAV